VVVVSGVDGLEESAAGRWLLTHDPQSVVEGLLIGAYAVGARRCFLAVEDDCELDSVEGLLAGLEGGGGPVERLARAGVVLDLVVRRLPRSFILREPGALLAALEGRQALPDVRYCDPLVQGWEGRPTVLETVETLAAVAAVFWQEPGETAGWAGNGRSTSAPLESRLLTVVDEGRSSVVKSVAFGTSLAEAVRQTIGNTPHELGVKVMQLGGPCGPFLADQQFDIPLTSDLVERTAGVIGAASLRLFPGKVCGVQLAKDAMARLHAEACGKCAACYEGTRQLLAILSDLAEGTASADELELALVLCRHLQGAALCDLGRSAPVPLLSCRELFAEDFASHLEWGVCALEERA